MSNGVRPVRRSPELLAKIGAAVITGDIGGGIMAKYLVLYRSETPAAEMMATMTPEQGEAGMEIWMKWSQSVGERLADFGMPLGPSKHVHRGSVASGDETVTGYSILEAGSIDDAVKLVKDHPHFQTPGDASIEVHEFLPAPGM